MGCSAQVRRVASSLGFRPCHTTFALLRSALRHNRLIPEIYSLLKRSETPRPYRAARSFWFLMAPRWKFYDSKFLRCSLKPNEFTSERLATGKPLFRNARSYYFTGKARIGHAPALKLYEPLSGTRRISFRHQTFRDRSPGGDLGSQRGPKSRRDLYLVRLFLLRTFGEKIYFRVEF